jgi:hypothetical protein
MLLVRQIERPAKPPQNTDGSGPHEPLPTCTPPRDIALRMFTIEASPPTADVYLSDTPGAT